MDPAEMNGRIEITKQHYVYDQIFAREEFDSGGQLVAVSLSMCELETILHIIRCGDHAK